jgi:hypothetical protein
MITGTKKGRLFWWPRPVAAAPTSHGANGQGACMCSLAVYFWSVATNNLDVICQRANNGLFAGFIFVAVVMGFTYLTIDLIQPNLTGDLSLHNQCGCTLTYCIFFVVYLLLCSCLVF